MAELLRQCRGRVPDLERQLLERALDVQLPALVAEVALELAGDAGLRVGGQVPAEPGIEVVDRLKQADVANLDQILGEFRAARVTLHAGQNEAPVAADELLA